MITKAKVIGSNVSYETYSAQDPEIKRGHPQFSMSRGELVNCAVNPARWLAGFKLDDESTPSTTWGQLIDCLLTSPVKFSENFAVTPETYPDKKTGEQKPWTFAANFCKEWREDHRGKTIIKADAMLDAAAAVKAIEANSMVKELFAVSKKQVLVIGFWEDEATGIQVPIRGLLDLVPPNDHAIFGKWLGDFKTARNGNPATWDRVISDSAYDLQAALYMDLFTAATNEDRVDFVHVVQENVFPFHVVSPLPAMSAEFLSWGRTKYRAALALYCQCLSTGVWPSFAPVGMQFGATQIIGPENVWSYKSMAGAAEFRPPVEREEQDTKPATEIPFDNIP